jgi:hypothetical protein
MAVKNSLLDDQLVEKSNGVYKFDPAAIRVGLIAGIGGMLLFGTLGILAGKDENFSSRSWILYLLPSLGFIFVLSHIAKLSGRTLHISTDRISVQDKRGNEIGSLPWVEFANLSERRKMAQLALWDKSGTRRLLIDLQFENFNLIRSRILGEYAKVFTLKPLPIVFQSANSFLFESFVLAVGAAFFVWGSWRTLQQGQTGASIVFFCFVILALLSFLKLYPQLGGLPGYLKIELSCGVFSRRKSFTGRILRALR